MFLFSFRRPSPVLRCFWNKKLNYYQYRLAYTVPMSFDTESSLASIIPSSSVISTRSRSSWIWAYMDGGRDALVKIGEHEYWKCSLCFQQYKTTGGTKGIANHLIVKHGKLSPKSKATIVEDDNITVAVIRSHTNANKRRKIHHGDDSFNPRVFEELLLEWIAVCSISFNSCQDTRFKDLLKYLNPSTINRIPTRSTLQRWSMQQYYTRKEMLKQELGQITQKVHLSIDLWTGQNKAYIGVVAHYFQQSLSKAPVLIFREIKGRHTGENQAIYVMEALVEYNLTYKLGYMMLDNASNNDTLIQCIEDSMIPIVLYEVYIKLI